MRRLKSFRANDVRGIYGKDIDDKLAYDIGRALVELLKCNSLVIGRDMRVSSPALSKSLINGVIDSGSNVVDLGLVDTPFVYFASGFLNLPGVMVTASHNPAKYNGFKIMRPGAVPVDQKNGLLKIKKIVEKNSFKKKEKGRLVKKDLARAYKKHIFSFVNLKKVEDIKVAVDAGNGTAGKIVPLIFKDTPLKVAPLYFRVDGKFPNHVPNPVKKKNLKDIKKFVRQKKADFGISFDGDMDRVVFIDEGGNPIETSKTSALLAKHFLKKKSSSIVYSLILSRIVPETIKKHNGEPIREKVGHSFIKNSMIKSGSVFGAEYSGHYYFKKNYCADSAIIASLIVSEIYSGEKIQGKKFSDLFREFDKYSKADEVSLSVRGKDTVIKKIEEFYKKKKPKKIDRLDGISIDFEEFWFNVRKSNTEPFLRVNMEAVNKKILKNELRNLLKFIKSSQNHPQS